MTTLSTPPQSIVAPGRGGLGNLTQRLAKCVARRALRACPDGTLTELGLSRADTKGAGFDTLWNAPNRNTPT